MSMEYAPRENHPITHGGEVIQDFIEYKAVRLIKPLPDHEVGEVFNLEGDGFIEFSIFYKDISFYPKHWPEYFEECVIKKPICNCHEDEEC